MHSQAEAILRHGLAQYDAATTGREEAYAIGALISAANPEAIRELLDSLDAMRGALTLAVDALAGGLWDYGPGQDEHDKCNEVLAKCRDLLTKDDQ